jgi:hypothetical protein
MILVKIILNVVGIIVAIFGLLGLILVSREVSMSLRFGGPGGGFLGTYQATAALIDAAIALAFFAVAGFLLRDMLKKETPRTILIVAAIAAILLGINAARIS